ncbi:hypothetical protein AFLA_011099 [Aspergillus flavus NRRL3357]|nr:hypothetical protein AFLA_011099 [Aspergillus flavus NRRL3357]
MATGRLVHAAHARSSVGEGPVLNGKHPSRRNDVPNELLERSSPPMLSSRSPCWNGSRNAKAGEECAPPVTMHGTSVHQGEIISILAESSCVPIVSIINPLDA